MLRHLQTALFQTWYDDRDHYTLHFDISLDGLNIHLRSQFYEKSKTPLGAGIAQLVVLGLAVHSVAGSILLWGHFPIEGIFPLELTWFKLHSPQNSFRWEYKPRSNLCTHAFHGTDSKDPDVHVLDGWMPTTKTHPARTIHEDGMWLP